MQRLGGGPMAQPTFSCGCGMPNPGYLGSEGALPRKSISTEH